MAEQITKVQRWLDLIAYLIGRHFPVPVEEIMEKVPAYAEQWGREDAKSRNSARRKFERDKDELRTLGIPLETVSFTINYGLETAEGYRLSRRDFYLPYLRLVEEAATPRRGGAGDRATIASVELREEEARAALDALHRVSELPAFPLAAEARSAFRKLSFDLDPARFDEPRLLFVEPPGAEGVLEILSALSDALLARKRVTFRYYGIYRDQVSERDVAPYALTFQRGHWYLIGHDAARDAVRLFRVMRIEGAKANRSAPATPDYEIPADFTAKDYVGREPWSLGDEPPLVAHVLFHFPASLWAERNGRGELVEERPDGAAVRAFTVHQPDPFLRWLLTLEGEATLLSPPNLGTALRTLAERVAAQYATEARHG
jgi:proteasome accessory factor B